MFNDPVGTVAGFSVPLPGLASPIRPGFVVAIPVRDEEKRLPACLHALARQRRARQNTQAGVFDPARSCVAFKEEFIWSVETVEIDLA